jgi:hypothetical protein
MKRTGFMVAATNPKRVPNEKLKCVVLAFAYSAVISLRVLFTACMVGLPGILVSVLPSRALTANLRAEVLMILVYLRV